MFIKDDKLPDDMVQTRSPQRYSKPIREPNLRLLVRRSVTPTIFKCCYPKSDTIIPAVLQKNLRFPDSLFSSCMANSRSLKPWRIVGYWAWIHSERRTRCTGSR
jgi:hypothetical protein